MRTTTSRPLRAAGATLASLSLVLGLGACSSDNTLENFCSDSQDVIEADAPEDQEGLKEFSEKVKEITAPEGIEGDWAVLQAGMEVQAEVLEDVEMDDEEALLEAQQEALEKIDFEEFMEAGEKVDEFIVENCES